LGSRLTDPRKTIRRLNVLLTKTLAPTAAGALLLAAVLAFAPAAAQEVVQDEGAAYRAWHAASQAGDNAKAVEAAKAYLAQYPTGQYAEFIKKWLPNALMTALDAAIKEKRTADMISTGREILAADPENLNVLYALAFNIRRNELLASPPSFSNAPAAVELSKKAISLVESGKTLTGVQSFDKNATLAWLTQILAVVEQKNGAAGEAIKLYEKSTAFAPADPAIAGQNLLRVFTLRQAAYGDAAKAYNAFPEADRSAAEPTPEVKAARDKVNAEADALIGSAAGFVAFAKVKGLAPAMKDRVNQVLETVYKSRFPEDASLAGLQKILQEKEMAVGAAAPPGA
jgi:tetratricopeptide (TPR) repeat protein